MSLLTLKLPAFLEGELQRGHPWVYRDHVPPRFRAPQGSFVRVVAGAFSGFALWDSESPIALRVYSRKRVPDARWVLERVRAAKELRTAFLGQETTAFRLLFGEGDGLPGVTCDVYGRYAALVTYADSVDTLVPWVVAALRQELKLDGIVRRRRRADSEGETRSEALVGELPAPFVVLENGMKLEVDLVAGQKTGLFLDHRENRRTVEALAGGRSVLNCFAYTGAFSLYALRGQAAEVVSADIGKGLAEAAAANLALNRLDPARHSFVTEDCFALLDAYAKGARRFQMVILDPPSFARQKSNLHAAARAYTRLNSLALRCLEPGGLLVSASCTSQIGPEQFRGILAEAAAQSQTRLQIVHEAGQPADHPVPAGFPEGRYLKFVVARALPLA